MCTYRCRNAKSPRCRCSCGGTGHGTGRRQLSLFGVATKTTDKQSGSFFMPNGLPINSNLDGEERTMDGLIDLSPANQLDVGRVWGLYDDQGRITVIGHSSDGKNYDRYEVVYHRFHGPLGNTNEYIAEFPTLEMAVAFGKDYAKQLNEFGYRDVG